ncbi:MAG: GTP-binding protein [archaeon]|nr:GTP-binding protein [archaeon]
MSAADAEEVTRLRASVPSRTTPNLFSCGPLSYQILAYILENLDAYKDTITWMPTSRFATSSITATTTSPKWVLTPDRIREVFEEVYGESIWAIVGPESKTRQILQVSALRSTAVCTVPEYKIVLLGAGGVGKTQIVEQLISGNFTSDYQPTVETQSTVPLVVDGQECVLQILDTAGQDEFSAIRKFWMEEGNGFMLVYSVSSPSSLDELVPLRDEIVKLKGFSAVSQADSPSAKPRNGKSSKASASAAASEPATYYAPVPMMLVGSKADLPARVRTEQAKLLAGRLGCYFTEVSAKTRWNIPKCFYDLVRAMRRVEGPPKSQGEADWRRREVERREKELKMRERRMKETEKQINKWRKKVDKKHRKSTRANTSSESLLGANTIWSHPSRKDDSEITLEQLMEEGANIKNFVATESVAKHIASTLRLPELSDESYRSVQVRLQAFEFKVEEPTELYIQLYDNTRKAFISEEFQILLNPRTSVLSIPLSIRTAIFTDISPQELQNELQLVCRLLRRSAYNRFSENAVSARFPAGYAVCPLETQLASIRHAFTQHQQAKDSSQSLAHSSTLESYSIVVL